MVWGYSFLFGNTLVRPRKWSKIRKYKSQNIRDKNIKQKGKKTVTKKRRKRLFNAALPLNHPRKSFRDRSQSFVM